MDIGHELDADGGPPSPAPGSALRRAELGIRLALGFAWLALAVGQAGFVARPGAGLARLGLAACGLGALLGLAPRTLTAVGTAVALGVGGTGPSGLLVLALALIRIAISSGESGGWLREIRRLEIQRAEALVAMELARARARSGGAGSDSLRAVALADAGDAYERAGEIRRELERRGAEPSRASSLVRPLAAGLGFALGLVPAWRRRLEARLVARLGSP